MADVADDKKKVHRKKLSGKLNYACNLLESDLISLSSIG